MKIIQVLTLLAVLAHLGVSIYDIVQRSRVEKMLDQRRAYLKAGDQARQGAMVKLKQDTKLDTIEARTQSISDRLELLLDVQGIPTE